MSRCSTSPSGDKIAHKEAETQHSLACEAAIDEGLLDSHLASYMGVKEGAGLNRWHEAWLDQERADAMVWLTPTSLPT